MLLCCHGDTNLVKFPKFWSLAKIWSEQIRWLIVSLQEVLKNLLANCSTILFLLLKASQAWLLIEDDIVFEQVQQMPCDCLCPIYSIRRS